MALGSVAQWVRTQPKDEGFLEKRRWIEWQGSKHVGRVLGNSDIAPCEFDIWCLLLAKGHDSGRRAWFHFGLDRIENWETGQMWHKAEWAARLDHGALGHSHGLTYKRSISTCFA
ncbi:hypothetical protein Pyn_37146 [Prunus yedoensis var. nudiflora]|uniref:Uncharacterized protein n=1 Tax=Prunus yedoensis var. nudiflora TaxID=2094558 RepID=A0A314Y270_PRUYE|nr:hypothetical protein Pyn_37146 [Prunus yedoensis var. nudiflora]